MATPRSASQINRDIEALTARLTQLQGELKTRESMPEEPPPGSVIRFRVQYTVGGACYDYVAYRYSTTAIAHWVITGQKVDRYTWEQVLDLMMEDHAVADGTTPLEYAVYRRTETITHKVAR